MSLSNAVAVPMPAASKSFIAASLAPLAGLFGGCAALYFSRPAYDLEQFLEMLGMGGWRTSVSLGVATCGALLASWAVGAMVRGRRVPLSSLLVISSAIWLVGVALTAWDLRGLFALLEGLSVAERPEILAGGMYLAHLPRLIGAFGAAGMLLGAALALALASTGSSPGGHRLRNAVLGGLATAPLMGIAVVAALQGAAPLAWSLAGLVFPLLMTCALASTAARSMDDRAVQLANRAVWLGAAGTVTGGMALLAAASLEVCEAVGSSSDTLTRLNQLSWGAEQLGVMRWATGATLLACLALGTGFTLFSTRREATSPRTVLGTMGAVLIFLAPLGANALLGAMTDGMLSSVLKVRSVPSGFEPVRLPGANAFHLTHENTRSAAVLDTDFIVAPGTFRFSEDERFAESTLLSWESLETDEGLQRLKEQLGEVLPRAAQRALHERERSGKSSPALSIALDARVPMRVLARVIAVAREAGAEGLFFVGQSADHDDPTVRGVLRAHAPNLESVLDAPLGVSTTFAPPDDERASERLLLRARLTGEDPFEVSSLQVEGPSLQVDPARQVSRSSDEPDMARVLAPSGPAPVVLLSVSTAPSGTLFLRAAAALRARGFQVVLEP